MKINTISFGARIDRNTMDFLVKAREQNLDTKKMETLLKQVSPEGEINSATDMEGNLLFMYDNANRYYCILPNKSTGIRQNKTYKTNQTTVDLITSKLENIKKREKNTNNEKVKFHKIYKRDHRAELIEIFGEPLKNIYDNAVVEQDY